MNTMTSPKNNGTKQLFSNSILEKLTRTHIAVPLTVFAVYAAALLYWSITHTNLSVGFTILLFFAGFIVFTWVEYQVHRHIFHLKPLKAWRKKFQYTVHGVHHEYPKDKDRLAMPPVLSITIATLLLFLLRLIMGDFVFAFLPGFLVGYALYLSIHYLVHAYAPPKNFLKQWWINHSIHHYKDGKIVFGVSSPLWDYVYGTMKSKEA
ncbi:MAG: sterol desaturase family protein [Flammeovirgaceae bacterium]|nr:sterol desaturase family protein [Flammeovirgaceae bacterium]